MIQGKISIIEEEDQLVVLNMENGVFYGLDEVGTKIWRCLEKKYDVEEIIDFLVEEYKVQRELLERDVNVFFTKMTQYKLVCLE